MAGPRKKKSRRRTVDSGDEQDTTCRQLPNLSLSSDDRAVSLWPERQHVPLPFGGASSTGRPPVLLPVHVLRERSFLKLKCQQPLDRCGQADRTLKIRLFRDKFVDIYGHGWLKLVSDLYANSWSEFYNLHAAMKLTLSACSCPRFFLNPRQDHCHFTYENK